MAGKMGFLKTRKRKVLFALFVVVILVVGILGASRTKLLTSGTDLKVVGYDEKAAMADMNALTGMGPRPAGSDAEMQGAQYIASVFEAAGLETTIWTYDMKAFSVDEARVSLVKYGPLMKKPMVSSSGYIKDYTHIQDFVLMGFSGTYHGGEGPLAYRNDLAMLAVGNGSADNPQWASCQGYAAFVTQENGTPPAGSLMRTAMSKGCAAVVLHNTMYASTLGYIPIYKGIYFEKNETDPTIPIFMTSKAMGDELKAGISTSKLRLHIVVTVQVKPVPVVEGILNGTGNPNEWVAIGAHMDTVYNGPGADDNTAGTVAVTGLARAMAKERPKRAIRFLAFGAEELGLKGAAAYLESQPSNVKDFCKLLFNLDMPNIDLERGNTGNIVSNSNWTVGNLDMARDKLNKMEDRYQKYDLTIAYVVHTGGSDNVVFDYAGIPAGYADGSGSLEYHTFKDDTSRINIESIGLEARIVGSAALAVANK